MSIRETDKLNQKSWCSYGLRPKFHQPHKDIYKSSIRINIARIKGLISKQDTKRYSCSSSKMLLLEFSLYTDLLVCYEASRPLWSSGTGLLSVQDQSQTR